jgi:putative membrane protein
MHLVLHWLADALIILAVAKLIPGITLRSFGSALVVAAVLGVLNLVLGHFLVFVGSVVALPAILVTFGLFYFVVRLAVNTFLLWMTDKIVDGFEITGMQPLVLASLAISVLHHLIARAL